MEVVIIAFIVGCLVGGVAGWWLHKRYTKTYGPRRDTYDVRISPTTTLRLHYLGTLSDAQFRVFCQRITDREPFRLIAFTRPPRKIMSRAQFEGVRKEMVDRGMAWREMNRTTVITPPGYAFCRWGAKHCKPTIGNQIGK